MKHLYPNLRRAVMLSVLCAFITPYMHAQIPLLKKLSGQAEPANAASAAEDPLGRGNPRSTVSRFVLAARNKSYERAAMYLSVPKKMQPQAEELAQQLQEMLDHGFFDDVKNLSAAPEGSLDDGLPLDRELIGNIRTASDEYSVELVRVEDKDYGRIWLFSPETVEQIPAMHKGLTSAVHQRVPQWLQGDTYFSLQLWQWLGLVVFAVAGWLAAFLVMRMVALAVKFVQRLRKKEKPGEDLRPLLNPLIFLIAMAVYRRSTGHLDLPLLDRVTISRLMSLLNIVAATWLWLRIADWASSRIWIWMIKNDRIEGRSVLPMGRKVAKMMMVFIAFLALVDNLGFSVPSVIAGLGLGGIAVALAAQKTIENFFGGLTLLFDRPVRLGELCKFGEQLGYVEDIGLRSTRLRTVERTLVTIPNATFSTMQLENLSKRDRILFRHTLNLRYETTAEQMRYVLVEVRRMLERHPMVDNNTPRVRFLRLATSSLDVEVFAYVSTTSGDTYFEVQQDLLLRLMGIVEAAGTGFAFPSTTVYHLPDSPAEEQRCKEAAEKVKQWREKGALELKDYNKEQKK